LKTTSIRKIGFGSGGTKTLKRRQHQEQRKKIVRNFSLNLNLIFIATNN
jgi:hypothetical protein